jgi:hypothetical protein
MPANGDHVLLINLPINGATQYTLSVSKTGYTTGFQSFDQVTLDASAVGAVITDAYSKVSVPPNTNLNLVLDWNDPGVAPALVHPNLDMYLWLPSDKNGIIGHNTLSGYTNGAADLTGGLDSSLELTSPSPFLGSGTLLSPKMWGDLSPNAFSPYAIHNFNGEIQVDTSIPPNSDPAPAYYPAMESISILGDPVSKPSANAPMIKPYFDKISGETYTVMVTDNLLGEPGTGYLTKDRTDIDHFVAPILRVWAKGYLVPLHQPFPQLGDLNYYGVKLENGDIGCRISTDGNTRDNDWWKALEINGSSLLPTATIINTCGGSTADFFPYGVEAIIP